MWRVKMLKQNKRRRRKQQIKYKTDGIFGMLFACKFLNNSMNRGHITNSIEFNALNHFLNGGVYTNITSIQTTYISNQYQCLSVLFTVSEFITMWMNRSTDNVCACNRDALMIWLIEIGIDIFHKKNTNILQSWSTIHPRSI